MQAKLRAEEEKNQDKKLEGLKIEKKKMHGEDKPGNEQSFKLKSASLKENGITRSEFNNGSGNASNKDQTSVPSSISLSQQQLQQNFSNKNLNTKPNIGFLNRPFSEETQNISISSKPDCLPTKNSSRKVALQKALLASKQYQQVSPPENVSLFRSLTGGTGTEVKNNEEIERKQKSAGYVDKFKQNIKNSQFPSQSLLNRNHKIFNSQSLNDKSLSDSKNNPTLFFSMSPSDEKSNQIPLVCSPSILFQNQSQNKEKIFSKVIEKPIEECKVISEQQQQQNLAKNNIQDSSSFEDPNPIILNESVMFEIISKKDNNQIEKIERTQKIVKWKYGEFIGAGSFGQVFTAMNCNTGEIFVVKKVVAHSSIAKLDNNFLDEQEKELRIMQTLSHKHIIQYKGHERQSEYLCIFLEYMSEGTIEQMLKKFGALEEQTIRVYAQQVLSGIEYLHSRHVIHKDIKGANILVASDGIVKLSDFGCAKQLEITLHSTTSNVNEMNKTLKGSVPWMSPEVVTQTKYDTKADIWSFGCTLVEMASGKPPWSNYEFDNPFAAIMKIGLSDEIPEIPSNISPELLAFIQHCLQRDPANRKTAAELLLDPFLQDCNSI